MINFISPINNQTGYGITGYNLWNNLSLMDDITLFPIGPISIDPLWSKDDIVRTISNILQYDKNAPCFKNFHAHDLLSRPNGKSIYGALTFFEINKLKPIEKINLNNLDIAFVASEWAKNILVENDIKNKIVVCPQGVDTSIFDHNIKHDKQDNIYRFINIGKWETRKGHDILVDIFNMAFDIHDDVELFMMNHNPFLNSEETNKWINLYKNSKLGEKIKIIPRSPSQKDVASIMSFCDCGIFPSRAEGWNNEAIEMLAMNKPIIITNYSAHTEYCTKDNSALIQITSLESANDKIWFDGYGEWAHFGKEQIEQTVDFMRYYYKNRISTNIDGLTTAQKYTWHQTATIINKELCSEQ